MTIAVEVEAMTGTTHRQPITLHRLSPSCVTKTTGEILMNLAVAEVVVKVGVGWGVEVTINNSPCTLPGELHSIHSNFRASEFRQEILF
jgi:hypothetical protein